MPTDAPDYEYTREEEADERIAVLAGEIPTLPDGPHKADLETELRKLRAERRTPNVSGAVRPLMQ